MTSSPSASPVLEQPLIVIQPSGRWAPLELRALWPYRDLLFFLTWRDVQVRYKQTLLGVAWAVLQPVLTLLIFTVLFGRLAHISSGGAPYALFAYCGLLPWTFFANSVTNGSNSLVGSASLITKVYFPRIIIPAAAVLAGLVDLAVAFVLLCAMLFYYQIHVTWAFLALPLLVLETTLLACAVGLWMAALNVKYRDIRYALPFVVQIWMFATPIIYSVELVPQRWRWLLYLNPMAGVVQGYRWSMLGTPLDWLTASVTAVSTLLLLTFAGYFFRRMEKNFADLV